ncbi:DUF6233 domain-containing protein [Streptomyces sp. NBC_01431]|uniref:DUF6233 domain-containing protein n=1 Tax=Streptomyces sp. NBC_01431 TaxID=2903863 RepID=UPI002E3406E2|nr:DUF6233 domain-containing protein [Streptomyces sp. NBC_01431]
MYDNLPPDLPRLRTLETFFALGLDEIRKAIAVKEQQEAAATARRAPPPVPDWIISTGRPPSTPGAAGARTVHVGGCGMAHGTIAALTHAQALRALTVEDVPPCQYCRPDSELGVLD